MENSSLVEPLDEMGFEPKGNCHWPESRAWWRRKLFIKMLCGCLKALTATHTYTTNDEQESKLKQYSLARQLGN